MGSSWSARQLPLGAAVGGWSGVWGVGACVCICLCFVCCQIPRAGYHQATARCSVSLEPGVPGTGEEGRRKRQETGDERRGEQQRAPQRWSRSEVGGREVWGEKGEDKGVVTGSWVRGGADCPRWALSWSIYNKPPQTGWFVNKRSLFLTILEAGSPRSGGQPGRVAVKALCRGQQAPGCVLAGRKEGALWGVCNEAADPIHEGSTVRTKRLPKAPPLSSITLAGRISICEFQEDRRIQCRAGSFPRSGKSPAVCAGCHHGATTALAQGEGRL